LIELRFKSRNYILIERNVYICQMLARSIILGILLLSTLRQANVTKKVLKKGSKILALGAVLAGVDAGIDGLKGNEMVKSTGNKEIIVRQGTDGPGPLLIVFFSVAGTAGVGMFCTCLLLIFKIRKNICQIRERNIINNA